MVQIQNFINEKYEFWEKHHLDLTEHSGNFWVLHKLAETEKRINHVLLATEAIGSLEGKRVMDVGIAWGMWPHIMARLGAKVTGVDWSELYNQDGLQERHPTLNDVVAFDFTKDPWPFKDNSFDMITHLDLIEHVHPPLKHMLDEMHRVLKPKGVLLLTTPNLASFRKRLDMILGNSPTSQIDRFYSDDPFIEHIKEYTMSELKHLCQLTKFKITATRTIDHLYFYKYAHASRLTKVLYKIYKWVSYIYTPLKDTLVVIAKK
jgi:2-polyprenyl-3-methyl-5-hydroxy-6-metoxy-1,4-benzoquinol methylase